ncbi:hypothetical protein ACH4F6_31660 [Streptomyces sp. NPDC017936]|uniref:hypothetical protein n=1 Tax=Streptomyces sp. NPDC017936 TaxID=3365016 RepID=UPI0037B4AF64
MTTDQPARYRRTPAEIEAVQWTGTNADALRAFAGSDFDTIDPEDRIEDPDQDAQLLVEASHWVGIKPTDWVVKYEGYFVAKADATFRAVWEPAVSPVPPPTDRAAVLTEAIAALDKGLERFFKDWPEEPKNSPWVLGWKDATTELRRMATAGRCVCDHPADEHSVYGCADGCGCEWMPKPPAVGEQPETQETTATVHAIPLPGSNGISSCCGRPPCEFVGERVTRDPDEVTCRGPE